MFLTSLRRGWEIDQISFSYRFAPPTQNTRPISVTLALSEPFRAISFFLSRFHPTLKFTLNWTILLVDATFAEAFRFQPSPARLSP